MLTRIILDSVNNKWPTRSIGRFAPILLTVILPACPSSSTPSPAGFELKCSGKGAFLVKALEGGVHQYYLLPNLNCSAFDYTSFDEFKEKAYALGGIGEASQWVHNNRLDAGLITPSGQIHLLQPLEMSPKSQKANWNYYLGPNNLRFARDEYAQPDFALVDRCVLQIFKKCWPSAGSEAR